MKHVIVFIVVSLSVSLALGQGSIEAEEVVADTVTAAFKGDGSRITGLPGQLLTISETGDTLTITGGNFVIIPGISASNSGTAFANAGADILNSCETSFNLQADQLSSGNTGLWSIEAGVGGNLINSTLPQALFIGQEGESYTLKWTVQHQGGSSSFDLVNISIAIDIETSTADAGENLFAIMTQTVTLNGNAPDIGSEGKWEIISGDGGILGDATIPNPSFTGVAGETYRLRWKHFNACSTSTDDVNLTFSESASGTISSNGRYYIPDPKFRLSLQILNPSVMDGDSLIVAMGDQVDQVKVNNLDVLNLDGLQFLTNVKILNLSDNRNLKSIPYFAPTLRKLVCGSCSKVEIVPNFPPSLDTLNVGGWDVVTIPELPLGLKYLELRGFSKIGGVPFLPDSCKYVRLFSLGENFGFGGDLVFTTKIPEMTETFEIGQTAVGSFPSLPIDRSNLQTLAIYNTEVDSMPSLIDLINLTNIFFGDSEFIKLDSLPLGLTEINVQGNPILCVENKPAGVADILAEFPFCP